MSKLAINLFKQTDMAGISSFISILRLVQDSETKQLSSIYYYVIINVTRNLFIPELSSSANRFLTLDFLFDINTFYRATIYKFCDKRA